MPKSFKSIILLISLLLGVSPLHGNLPCENGCENSCKCEKGKSPTGDSATDGGPGNSGTGTANGKVVVNLYRWGESAFPQLIVSAQK